MHRSGKRRAVRQLDCDLYQVTFNLRKETEWHDAEGVDPGREEKQAEEQDNRGISEPDRHFEHRLVNVVCKPEQAVCNTLLLARKETAIVIILMLQVFQVRG